jgi:hypothetical protein
MLIMEENQNIENRYREVFSGFEKEPPDRIWSDIHKVLHPEPKQTGFWSGLGIGTSASRVIRISVSFAAAAIILFLLFMWFSYGNHRIIRGHAFAGDTKMMRGTAYLFRVEDKTRPLDSVRHYGSALVDENGSYKFSHVAPGDYLLRIVPDKNAMPNKSFQPSWFDQRENPEDAHLIQVRSEDVWVDVHLLPGRDIPPQ